MRVPSVSYLGRLPRIILTAALLLSTGINSNFLFPDRVFAQTAASPRPAGEAYIVPFVTKRLANGLEVIVLKDSSVPLVTVELAVRNGSFTEPPEYHGLSHLYEHMFFKPNMAAILNECDQRPEATLISVCRNAFSLRDQIGDTSYLRDSNKLSVYNGTTREEIVNYYYTTTRDYLESAIKTINDSVRFPAFDPEQLEDEKKVVIGEIDRQEANPFGFLDRELRKRLFYKYPSRKDPMGTRESVRAATVEKMRTIQSRYYVPNNSALIVTGDADPETVFLLAEKIMGSWKPRAVDPFKEFPLVDHPPLEKSEGLIVERPADTLNGEGGENVFVEIGWQGPSIGKDDAATYAADVFSYIITQPDSRFQRNLVDTGLVASVDFGYYTQRNVGPINLVFSCRPDKVKQALAAIYREIDAFIKPNYYTDEELSASKTILETRDLFEREKASEYAHTLGFWWSSTGIDYFKTYHQRLRAVTRADIERYLKTYVIGKNHVAVALMTAETRKRINLTEADLIGGAK
ncbi:MAG TPA: pitrilysin family protein [Pyrinomonadaceae bacterium]|nr:pitrilysin family protein [Pyrinomonadaceae bacterium]